MEPAYRGGYLKRKLDGRLLRSIRHEKTNKTWRAKLKKKNCAPLINNPLVSTPFREDNMSLCSSLEYHMRKRNQKVILISSAGENEGKSTVTANLAALADVSVMVVREDCIYTQYINDCIDTLRRSTPDIAGYVFNNCYLSVLPHRSDG